MTNPKNTLTKVTPSDMASYRRFCVSQLHTLRNILISREIKTMRLLARYYAACEKSLSNKIVYRDGNIFIHKEDFIPYMYRNYGTRIAYLQNYVKNTEFPALLIMQKDGLHKALMSEGCQEDTADLLTIEIITLLQIWGY